MLNWRARLHTLTHHPKTPMVVTAFFAACFAWAVGDLAATLLEKTPVVAPVITTRDHSVDLGSFHFFGLYSANFDNLPNTELPLTLQGTIVTPANAKESQALISASGQPTLTYHEGDNLPEGATITHITGTYVIIDNHGSLEKVPLPVQTLSADKDDDQ